MRNLQKSTQRVFDFQYMQRQFEKKRIRKVTRFRFKYYVVHNNSTSRATIFTTQIETSTSLELLTNYNLKKKLKYLTNASRFLSVIRTQKNTIANYLIKKSRLNSILLSFVSISILVENSINKVDVLQILYETQIEIEKKL